MSARCDVAVIGGSIMGSSVALFLKRLAPSLDVRVIEPDPTYERASTPQASGGCRRLFSRPENIAMSQMSLPFIAAFAEHVGLPADELPDPGWRQGGYLFIVPPAGVAQLARNYELQRSMGVEVEWLDPRELARRWPSMRTGDLAAGVLSPKDGWCDPASLLAATRRAARTAGATYLQDRVVALDTATRSPRVARVVLARLASGATLAADAFVNAAGPWAGEVCALADMPLPVQPMRRFEHYFTTPNRIEPLPYVKDLDRLAFRPEGRGYSGGYVKSDEPRGFRFEIDHGYFERTMWPALAERFPAFEAARCERTWVGLYEQCELDGNPIVGAWRRRPNLYVVAGFSGHGMMHAPAAGRAIAELVVEGGFRTLDLGRLGYERVERGEPYPELGIV